MSMDWSFCFIVKWICNLVRLQVIQFSSFYTRSKSPALYFPNSLFEMQTTAYILKRQMPQLPYLDFIWTTIAEYESRFLLVYQMLKREGKRKNGNGIIK